MHTDSSNAPVPDIEAEIAGVLKAHPGLTREQLLKHLQREESLDAASRAPFPGPLREAFAGGSRGITLGVVAAGSRERNGEVEAADRADRPSSLRCDAPGEMGAPEPGASQSGVMPPHSKKRAGQEIGAPTTGSNRADQEIGAPAVPLTITYTLQPVTLALISALERIESPFVAMVEIISANPGKPSDEIAALIEKELHPTTEQLIATVACFITDIDTVEAELDKGAEHFRKFAGKTIGRRHHPADLARLNEAILLHYVDSFATVVDYRARKPEDDRSFPLAPAEPVTVSAGASTCAEC